MSAAEGEATVRPSLPLLEMGFENRADLGLSGQLQENLPVAALVGVAFLYSKLGIHGRIEAVERGRSLDLIAP